MQDDAGAGSGREGSGESHDSHRDSPIDNTFNEAEYSVQHSEPGIYLALGTMRNVRALLALFFSLSVLAPQSHAASLQRITVTQLQQMFADIRAAAKWNVDGPLLWGYYFTDPDPKKLDPLAKHLAQTGYRVVGIYQADDKSTYFLHVERVEHLTVNTLNQRNQEFYNLAEQYNVASYDGMDVGPSQ